MRHTFSLFLLIATALKWGNSSAQILLYNQSGNAADTWGFTSTGADPTASAEALSAFNYTSAPASLVVGGNTPGGSCIDGGSGNGESLPRTFTFDEVDISSSNQFTRTLTFNWGNRHPVCTGTGWDTGESLVFTPILNGVAATPIVLANGVGDAIFPIQNNQFSYDIDPCVSTFGFILSINTNRRDELLFLDDVELSAPNDNGSGSVTQVDMTVCANQLPFDWNGLNITEAGTFQVAIPVASGCDSLVQLNLTVNNLIESFQTLNLCETDAPITINGQSIATPGTYAFNLQSAAGCDSVANFEVFFNPVYQLNLFDTICGDQLPFTWQGLVFNQSGNQDLVLQTQNGCDSTLTLNLFVRPLPNATFTVNNSVAFTANPEFTFNYTGSFDSFMYDFGDGNTETGNISPTVVYSQNPDTYLVTFSVTLNGCTASSSMTVQVSDNPEVYYELPNVFTPNNDGSNDVYLNNVSNEASMQLSILNRWGNLLFETTDPSVGWVGQDSRTGLDCPNGVYFFKLILVDKLGEERIEQGFIHLIR